MECDFIDWRPFPAWNEPQVSEASTLHSCRNKASDDPIEFDDDDGWHDKD